MSEQNKTNEPKTGPKGGPGKKFPGGPRFNFNFYWIYGLIIVVLIVTQLFQWGSAERQTTFEDLRGMLTRKEVAKIEVTSRTAHISIKKDKLNEPQYKNIQYKKWGNVVN